MTGSSGLPSWRGAGGGRSSSDRSARGSGDSSESRRLMLSASCPASISSGPSRNLPFDSSTWTAKARLRKGTRFAARNRSSSAPARRASGPGMKVPDGTGMPPESCRPAFMAARGE